MKILIFFSAAFFLIDASKFLWCVPASVKRRMAPLSGMLSKVTSIPRKGFYFKHCIVLLDKGSPTERKSLFIWALPVWGGGSKPLPGWFVAPIFRRNVHVQTGICLILGGQKACQDGLGHLFYRRIFTGGLPIQNWARK